MISELVEYGKWLNDNGIETFGKNTSDNDWVLPVYSDNHFKFGDFSKKKDFNFKKYYDKSNFSNDFSIDTNQMYMIPSKSNLLGLSPFFIKLDHDFLKKGELNEKNISKFKNKIERSIEANENDNEFIKYLKDIFDNPDEFLDIRSLSQEDKSILIDFFKNNSVDEVKRIIVEYYQFLYDSSDKIINLVNNVKESEEYDKKDKSNFYLALIFGNEYDLINDILILFSQFYKKRDEHTDNFKDGICSMCGKIGTIYPQLGSYAITKIFSFNNNDNVENSKLKICKDCTAYLTNAERKLKSHKVNDILLIPKSKSNSDFKEFSKIYSSEVNNFKAMNKILKEISADFNFDLIVYTKERDRLVFHKYIENYRTFSADLSENSIVLYNDGLNYLFHEKGFDNKKSNYINNLFDVGNVIRDFFIKIEDSKVIYPKLNNLFEIYTKDFSKIFNNFDASTLAIFSKYMHNIFSYVYELNFDALNINMINEIFINTLLIYQKNSISQNYDNSIKDKLNDYFMIRSEFLGDVMIRNENISRLKVMFSNDKENDNQIEINDDFIKEINNMVKDDPAIKYYLLGQFIRLIDNTKKADDKNGNVFSNFIENVNRHNIKNLFATEILQKNTFYINKMNKKGKVIFNILENNLNTLFNDNFSYEDYIILLFTGYYTTNILSSSYGGN